MTYAEIRLECEATERWDEVDGCIYHHIMPCEHSTCVAWLSMRGKHPSDILKILELEAEWAKDMEGEDAQA
jgi:hypothetical protein